MTRYKVLTFFFLVGHLSLFGQSKLQDKQIKKIVFLGNSITYSGTYVTFIDAYLTLRDPQKKYEIINLGLPSETVSGLSEPDHASGKFPRPVLEDRLGRVLSQTQPDLVIACYGMNDGIYKPFDLERFQAFKKGILDMREKVILSGAEIIHITPPVYDGDNVAYGEVLERYSQWLVDMRKAQWEVVDLHVPMKRESMEQRLSQPDFSFSPDGVHPDQSGHLFMAKQLLLYLGYSEIAQSKDIKNTLMQFRNGMEVFELIQKRQQISKNAWLTAIGHKRPGIKAGLERSEAEQQQNEINIKIETLLTE